MSDDMPREPEAGTVAKFPPTNDIALFLDDPVSAWTGAFISTGLTELDSSLGGGLRFGQIAVIGGVPGVGKSLLALGIVRHVALRLGLNSVFLAPGSLRLELVTRLAAAEARVPLSHLRDARGWPDDLNKLALHQEVLAAAPLAIDAQWPRTASLEAITIAVIGWAGSGARLVVMDDINLAESGAMSFLNELRTAAMANEIAVVVVAHAGGTGSRPILTFVEHFLAHSEASNAIDQVIMLDREDLTNPESIRPGEAQIKIVKNRYGPPRDLTVAFQGHYARFVDMTH